MLIILVALLILPVAAALLLVFFRRSRFWSGLVPALTVSGIAGSILTSCYVFTVSTVPIGPYESGPSSWVPIVQGLLLSMLIGFGVGVLFSSLVGIPYWYLSRRSRRAR